MALAALLTSPGMFSQTPDAVVPLVIEPRVHQRAKLSRDAHEINRARGGRGDRAVEEIGDRAAGGQAHPSVRAVVLDQPVIRYGGGCAGEHANTGSAVDGRAGLVVQRAAGLEVHPRADAADGCDDPEVDDVGGPAGAVEGRASALRGDGPAGLVGHIAAAEKVDGSLLETDDGAIVVEGGGRVDAETAIARDQTIVLDRERALEVDRRSLGRAGSDRASEEVGSVPPAFRSIPVLVRLPSQPVLDTVAGPVA